MKRARYFTPILFLAFFGAACIRVDLDRIDYAFEVSPNMRGTLEVRGINVHPSESEPEKRTDAIEFCSSGYRKYALDFVNHLSLKEPDIEVDRHTEYTCDVIAKGSFRNFPSVLAALFSEAEYEFRRTSTSFDFSLPPSDEEPEEDDFGGSVSILYSGTVVDTNAEDFERDRGYMAWSLRYMSRYGIRFRLGLPKADE